MALHEAKVDFKSALYRDMSSKWELVSDLLGGTESMRAASTNWLPQDEKEADRQYRNRLANSFLHGWYRRAVKKAVSKPFQEEITLPEGLSWKISGMEGNIDGEGRNITQFGRDLFYSGVSYGMSGIFVDYPVTGKGVWWSDYERKEAGILPVWRLIPAAAVLGWRSKKGPGGKNILTQLRLYENTTKDAGRFGEEKVERIRVYEPGTWELWEKVGGKNEYAVIDQGDYSLDYIPYFPFYTGRTGFMMAEPPMFDLAETELAHWQSYSDHRNILKFARLGILFSSGITKKEIEQNFVLGPLRLYSAQDKDASLKYVEYEGKALEAGVGDLERLERMMENQSIQPYIKKQVTATEKRSDESTAMAEIHMWIRGLENTMNNAFECSGNWVGEKKLPEDFSVNVFSEFSLADSGTEDLDLMSKLYMADKMPDELFWDEAIRRNFIPDTWDPKEIAAQLEGMSALGYAEDSEDLSGNFVPQKPEEEEK